MICWILRSTAILLLLAIVTVSACADTNSLQEGGNAIINGHQASVNNHLGRCQLKINDVTVMLDLSWPCDIHKSKNNKPRVRTFGQFEVFLVESSIPSTTIAGACETNIQAVRIKQSELQKASQSAVMPSEYTDKVATCPPYQWDQQMFTGLFKD